MLVLSLSSRALLWWSKQQVQMTGISDSLYNRVLYKTWIYIAQIWQQWLNLGNHLYIYILRTERGGLYTDESHQHLLQSSGWRMINTAASIQVYCGANKDDGRAVLAPSYIGRYRFRRSESAERSIVALFKPFHIWIQADAQTQIY